jgi:hypothetical protein
MSVFVIIIIIIIFCAVFGNCMVRIYLDPRSGSALRITNQRSRRLNLSIQ